MDDILYFVGLIFLTIFIGVFLFSDDTDTVKSQTEKPILQSEFSQDEPILQPEVQQSAQEGPILQTEVIEAPEVAEEQSGVHYEYNAGRDIIINYDSEVEALKEQLSEQEEYIQELKQQLADETAEAEGTEVPMSFKAFPVILFLLPIVLFIVIPLFLFV